jgi:hypothetical protein
LVTSAFYASALILSERSGGDKFHYDLGYHLDVDWKFSKDVIASMDNKDPPQLRSKQRD